MIMKNTLIMGAIGLLLGVIGNLFISLSAIGPGEEPNRNLGYVMTVLLAVTFGFWGSQIKRGSSEKIELPIRSIRIVLIVAWVIIFYFKFK